MRRDFKAAVAHGNVSQATKIAKAGLKQMASDASVKLARIAPSIIRSGRR